MAKYFTDNLKKRREALGLSMAQVAELIGVDKQTWYKWEHGRHSPTSKYLPKIAKALQTTEAELYSAQLDPAQVREDIGPGLAAEPIQPDTASSLTGDMTQWRKALVDGHVSQAQFDRAVELLLARLETVTRARLGGELAEIKCPHCRGVFRAPVEELLRPGHWSCCPLCGGALKIQTDPASGAPTALKAREAAPKTRGKKAENDPH
jgi:putative transcriptional regulator